MSNSVTDKKQNFFKEVSSKKDRDDLIDSIVKFKRGLQLKHEGLKVSGPQGLTTIKAMAKYEGGIVGVYEAGPPSDSGEVTVAFEFSKAMFFCTGNLFKSEGGKYILKFKKIFELQRRDAYRVTIPAAVIAAKVVITTVNKKPLDQEFRVSDLSAGGMGLAATENTAHFLPNASNIHGTAHVGGHAAVEFSAVVKYQRKISSEKPPIIHIGCEFQNVTMAFSQKITFLVNDCHRISFSRLAK